MSWLVVNVLFLSNILMEILVRLNVQSILLSFIFAFI